MPNTGIESSRSPIHKSVMVNDIVPTSISYENVGGSKNNMCMVHIVPKQNECSGGISRRLTADKRVERNKQAVKHGNSHVRCKSLPTLIPCLKNAIFKKYWQWTTSVRRYTSIFQGGSKPPTILSVRCANHHYFRTPFH